MVDIQDSELLKQNPFIFNEYDRYIACVGDNGGTDDDSILAGFENAAQLIINAIRYHGGTEDELVYPLVFTIRHCAELAIKIGIEDIRKIYRLKNERFPIVEKNLHTHDIGKLSSSIREVFGIDRRIEPLFSTALEYVKDYFFDVHGDVFRYEKDTSGNSSLKRLDISQISISLLESKFKRMMQHFKYGLFSLNEMIKEYYIGTFTKHLSRNDIQEIANQLPIYEKWKNQEFTECKIKIKSDYGIGSKELSEAINIIKENSLFRSMIGKENLLGKITKDEILCYGSFVKEFYVEPTLIPEEKIEECEWEELKNIQQLHKRKMESASGISDNALCTLAAFGDMIETTDIFCEGYERHFQHFKNPSISRDYLIKKIGTYNSLIRVARGMRFCGQITYLNWLNPTMKDLKIEDSNIFGLE